MSAGGEVARAPVTTDRWVTIPPDPWPPPDDRAVVRSRTTLAVLVLLAALKIWLTAGQPLTVIASTDERTFLLQAHGLLGGKWLGDYTIVSLVKAPFYAIFLASGFLLGIPTLLAQQVLYVLACSLVLVALRPVIAAWRPYQVILLYAVLVFNPMSFLGSPRLLRNHLYASLGLLLVACCIAIVTRAHRGLRTLLAWSVGCGVVLSALWLTREESIWVVPFLVVFTAAAGWRLWQAVPGRWGRLLLVLAVPYGLLALSILTVMVLNHRHYGIFAVTEIQTREFQDAFGALYRVTPQHPRRPYVVVAKETRERIYAASPAFAELKGFLEGNLWGTYLALSCQAYQLCTGHDVAWGWFPWQLREAAWRAGHHESAAKATRFYARLAAEIDAACTARRFDCLAPRSSLLPPWDGRVLRALPGAFVGALLPLITFRGFQLNSAASVGTPEELAEFEDLSREETSTPRSGKFSITGWVFSTKGPVQLSVHSGDGALVESTRRTFARPDVRDYVKTLGPDLPQAADTGFEITATCGPGCYIYVRTGQGEWIRAVPLDGSVKYFQSTSAADLARAAGKNANLVSIERGDVIMYVDLVKRAEAAGRPFQDRLRAWKRPILATIGSLYQKAVPVLAGIALLLVLRRAAVSWRERVLAVPDLVLVLVLALLFARTAALAFVDIVAIRLSSDPDYANLGYPLVLLFIGLLLLDPKFPSARRPGGEETELHVGRPAS